MPWNTSSWIIVMHIYEWLISHAATHTTTHCNPLQHTATHCNTLQHIFMNHIHAHIWISQITHAREWWYTFYTTHHILLTYDGFTDSYVCFGHSHVRFSVSWLILIWFFLLWRTKCIQTCCSQEVNERIHTRCTSFKKTHMGWWLRLVWLYAVAFRRLLKTIGLFCRI